MALFKTRAQVEAEQAEAERKKQEVEETEKKHNDKESEAVVKQTTYTIDGLYAGLSLGEKLIVFTALLSQIDFGQVDKRAFANMLDKSGIKHAEVFASDAQQLVDCIMNDPEIYDRNLDADEKEVVYSDEPSYEEVSSDELWK